MRELPLPQDLPVARLRAAARGGALDRCVRAARFVGAALATALVAALVVALPAAPASAADGSDFDAGNIITDEVFFDRTALTASQVQAFLRSKVPTCLAKPGDPDCLKNYRMTTPTRAKDAYCNKYSGATDERASKIIAKIAKACGVSAKVLLVLLQKEQSLVTSTAPTEYQYERATGFACPDTAPCDEQYFGFFNQVYSAARQYQRYADPNIYTWRSIGRNTLPYHPKSSCGTVEVDIKNQATLGLYFYTPYVPNAAALANMYGTGDSCSSYGNRNFWRGFTDWYGSTRIAVRGPIQKAWLASGGLDGVLGVQRAHQVCRSDAKFCTQSFQRGTVASSTKGAFAMTGTLEKAWRQSGAHQGPLAWPYSKASSRAADSSTLQRFTGGYLVDSARYGTRQVLEPAAKVWRKAKLRKGSLGLPKKDAKCSGAKRDKCVQPFVGGYVAAHPQKGSFAVTGTMAKFWKKKKLQKGKLGWPTSVASCPTAKGVTTCRQSFGGTRVVTSTKFKTRLVKGSIATVWDAKRAKVGNPVKNQKCSTTGKGKKKLKACTQQFTKGWISRSKLGTFVVAGKFAKVYSKNRSKLGAPTSNRTCTKKSGKKKVCTQTFTKGKIVQKGSKKPRFRS